MASPADLGSVTALWRQPASYAHFLGVELSLVYRGPLVVVMPNGVGYYDAAHPSASAGCPRPVCPRPAAQLTGAALTAVEKLAQAAGHPLALPAATAPPSAAPAGPRRWSGSCSRPA